MPQTISIHPPFQEQDIEIHHFSYRLEQRKRVQAHFHNNCEIVFYKNIEGVAIVGDQEQPIEDHSILYIPAYTNHEFKLSSSQNEFYVLRYWPAQCNVHPLPLGDHPLFMRIKPKEFSFLEQQLQWHQHFSNENLPLVAQALFTSIATGISELCPRLPQSHRGEAFRPLFSILDQKNRYSISVTEAANITGYSRSHFFALFKKLYHMDFSQYLLKRRMDVAKQLLKNSEHKIIEISQQLEYDNPSYFSKVFKQHTGSSPQQYRQKIKG